MVYEESAQVPDSYSMKKQSENHHSSTVQRLDSKSLLVIGESRILEAENYILVQTAVHSG